MHKVKFIFSILMFGLLSQTVFAAVLSQAEENKKNVLAFYEIAINHRDFSGASKFLGDHYIQHNPEAVDGIAGFKAYLAYMLKEHPSAHSEIKHVWADNDYVIIHAHAITEPGTRGDAVVDMFRLEDGKIVEHWDVIQPVPEKAANENGMF